MTLCSNALDIFLSVVLWGEILIEEESKENINLQGWLEKRVLWLHTDKRSNLKILLSLDVKKRIPLRRFC